MTGIQYNFLMIKVNFMGITQEFMDIYCNCITVLHRQKKV